ncbi:MAG: VTT domain-containing protein [Robiginitomaculum sp.]|nr:VTT domain-containing protein [Robiginitomaculum sp.]
MKPSEPQIPKANMSLWLSRLRLVVLLSLLAGLLYLLLSGFAPDAQAIEKSLVGIRDSSFGLPTVIAIFVIMGMLAVPQFVLIAACVFAFGSVDGSVFSWAGTMVSASLHFWLGRLTGAEPLQRFGGDNINKIVEFVSKNGFWSSLLVRVVPSGPFIFVNLALGVSRAKFIQFVVGTAIGIVPKIIAIAFVGQGLFSFSRQQSISLVMMFFALAAVIVLVIWMVGRAWKSKGNSLR